MTFLELLISATLAIVQPQPEHTASWYGAGNFHGQTMANGETFNPNANVCAHKSIPLGTTILVFSHDTGIAKFCKVEDRGPYAVVDGEANMNCEKHECHDIDLSKGVARRLGVIEKGVSRVQIFR